MHEVELKWHKLHEIKIIIIIIMKGNDKGIELVELHETALDIKNER